MADGGALIVNTPAAHSPWGHANGNDSSASGNVNPPGTQVRGKVVDSTTMATVAQQQVNSDASTGHYDLLFNLNAGNYNLFVAAPTIALTREVDDLTVQAAGPQPADHA
jgi:hypothetical protein